MTKLTDLVNRIFKAGIWPEDYLLKTILVLYEESPIPVSYTHLDVYKRQGLYKNVVRICKMTE